MLNRRLFWPALLVGVVATSGASAEWLRFRGPDGLGKSDEKGTPVRWSVAENIVWRTELPGAGASTPVTDGKRVYVTCYSGYGMSAEDPGKMEDLMRHLVCVDRTSGKVAWSKQFKPILPEHKYQGEGSYHGYAASTPAIDGDRLYVFFGKSGVYCFDLDGNEVWHARVGDRTNGWGSGTSPVVYGDLLIVNASVESGSLVALDRKTGKEVWRAGGVGSAWNTPMLVDADGKKELVVSTNSRLLAFDPMTGKPLWNADGVHRYVCPSVTASDGVVYALGGGHTSLAVRAGGRGDVTESHGVWRLNKGSNVSSPIYHEGHLYWTRDGDTVCCQEPKTGKMIYEERLRPGAGRIWSSPVLADGKLYYVSQHKGTYVVAATPTYQLLAHNVLEGDDSRTNASPAVDGGQLLLRNDRYLYCIGGK
jgi:outer membrane protein assembly factor BamB